MQLHFTFPIKVHQGKFYGGSHNHDRTPYIRPKDKISGDTDIWNIAIYLRDYLERIWLSRQ